MSFSRKAVSVWKALCLSGLALLSQAAQGEGVDFARDVKPVLEAKCVSCHNPNTAKGDLSMATLGEIRAAGEGMLVPGRHGESELYRVTVPDREGGKPEMPKKGDPFTAEEAKLLAAWIDAGAEWPEGLVLREASKADRSWWAYQPLQRTRMGEPGARNGDGGAGTPVDGFVQAAVEKKGLAMNPPAGARELIRRASYDLTGLPPTPEEVREFEAAYQVDADGAMEGLVERLLASPRYGERWGRHWLDVVRFGESKGYERNVVIDNLWPFRDYVIASINEDKPFDRLIREHLAGDVFGKGDLEVEVGSAFLVAGPYDDVGNQDVEQTAQIRANTMDEIINATGEAFLGMTLGCARCHDHKFDPILQRDYYGLYATFAGVRHGSRVVATAEEQRDRAKRLGPMEERKAALTERQKKLNGAVQARAKAKEAEYEARWTRPPVDRTGTEEVFAPVRARFVRLVCEAQDRDPAAVTGFGIDEFEVWSAGEGSRNVALASLGGKAAGLARQIEDFPGAYGPQHAIDGKTGARFLARGSDLTIELAEPVVVERVVFSSARGEETPQHGKFVFVADYRIEVSGEGEKWERVADGSGRKPVSTAHREHRWRKLEMGGSEAEELGRIRGELAAVEREIQAVPELPLVWVGMRSGVDAKGPFHVFTGGSPQKKAEVVVPASLSTMSEVMPGYELAGETEEAERRLALANWIGDAANPLTARVLANRVWQYHFGTGIVDTPNDFGYMGGRPAHPELLDFLAAKLMENGWRLKPMHRLIMMSQAYRQSSAWREEAAGMDGDSRYLWRFPPRRLSAEEIRDTMLQVSGKLNEAMGGPGFRLYHFMQDNVCTYVPLDAHGPETYRRAVYHQNARSSVVDLMTEFDQPDCSLSAPRRAETTTPLQALTMLNHTFTVDMAEAFAGRLEKEAAGEEARVRRAFQLICQRDPDGEESERCLAVVRRHGWRALGRALLNGSEMIYLD